MTPHTPEAPPDSSSASPADLSTLWGALLSFQAAARVLKRNHRNDFTGSDYLDLAGLFEAIGPALTDAGLVVVQSPTLEVAGDGRPMLAMSTRIVHAASGAELANTFHCPVKSAEAQAVGSAVSYARRYAIMAMLGLASERDTADDDGNAATHRPQDTARGAPPARPARTAPAATRPAHRPAPATVERKTPAKASPQAPPQAATAPPETPAGVKATKDEWKNYGRLAASWRGEEATKRSVLEWASEYRKTRGAPMLTGELLREATTRLLLAVNAPATAPASLVARAEWERIRADANEAAGMLADGSSAGGAARREEGSPDDR